MKKYGLIGSSLTHSFSKTFFTEYFSNNKIDASYDLIELASIDQFQKVLNKGFSGLNVTVPYKEKVIPFLDQLSKEASSIGAVNVIQFIDGKTIGHNSDAFGFKQSIKPFLTNLHERALILGTGGAAKAVNFVLKEIGITTFHCSRTPDQQKGLFSYGDINENMVKSCKLIVNCTPVGTFPNINDHIDFPFQYLTEEHLVIDLIYNPQISAFLMKSKQYGATIVNGESMLKEQALKSWGIWNS